MEEHRAHALRVGDRVLDERTLHVRYERHGAPAKRGGECHSAPAVHRPLRVFLPDQAAWSGTEGELEGNLHFCGERTSEDDQGYMEGAAESGERVGDESLAG